MLRHRLFFGLLVGGLLTGLSGCASSGVSAVNFSVRHVPVQERAGVLDLAEAALLREGFFVDHKDAARGVLTSFPVEEKSEGVPRRVGLVSRGTYRRVAEVRVERGVDALNVYCKVAVQERSSEAERMLSNERGGSDLPERTPIDRDVYATEEQRTSWRTVRRDRLSERAILDAIIEHAGGAVTAPP